MSSYVDGEHIKAIADTEEGFGAGRRVVVRFQIQQIGARGVEGKE